MFPAWFYIVPPVLLLLNDTYHSSHILTEFLSFSDRVVLHIHRTFSKDQIGQLLQIISVSDTIIPQRHTYPQTFDTIVDVLLLPIFPLHACIPSFSVTFSVTLFGHPLVTDKVSNNLFGPSLPSQLFHSVLIF